MSEGKLLSGVTKVTTVNNNQYIPLTDESGNTTIITLNNLKSAVLGGMDLNALEDGIFIMFHRNSDNYPLMVKPHKWSGYQNSGEIAEGVVIVEGGHVLVVAPTESPTNLLWSSAAVSGGGVTTSDRVTAMADWNGQSNTSKQIQASTSAAITNTASYAPGYCNLYSRVNSNGKGMTAGRWWLPSVAEMMMIYANMRKINYALSLINGADQLVESWYWTSTENSPEFAWYLYLDDGDIRWRAKASDRGLVRAVTAFLY